MAWRLHHQAAEQTEQDSYIGGKPKLPAGMEVPSCQLCNSAQTFFFQVAMPEGELWAGTTLAVYQCTRCADENHLIPEMLTTQLAGADIPEGFLTRYQRNFRFITFPSNEGKVVSDYDESLQFSEIRFAKGTSLGSFGKLGGRPEWLLGDESPATYGGRLEMEFLLQVVPDFQFVMTPQAAPQADLYRNLIPPPPPQNYYQLFVSNTLYLFGTKTGEQAVYAITQVD